MGFLKKAFDFVARPTHSRTMGILIFFILLAAVSLTVYVAQQQQQLRQRANAVCNDTSTLNCSDIPNFNPNSPCTSKLSGKKCRMDNKIFECQQEQ